MNLKLCKYWAVFVFLRAKGRMVYKYFMGANYNLHPAKLLSRVTFASGFKIGVGF